MNPSGPVEGPVAPARDAPLRVTLERPPKLGDVVLDQVRELIVTKQLAPGARLSEAGIAGLLGVSKTPVREALLQLRTIGLVEMVDGNARVVAPSATLIREAYEVRAGLEALTARLAATRASATQRDDITAAADDSVRAARAGDRAAFRDHDRRFHSRIAEASGNAIARQRIEEVLILCQTLRQRDVLTDWDSQVCADAHVEIARTITSGDGPRAAELVIDHVNYVMDKALAAFTGS